MKERSRNLGKVRGLAAFVSQVTFFPFSEYETFVIFFLCFGTLPISVVA